MAHPRPPNRRNPHPRRTHEPLQCSRHRRDRSRGLNLKGKEALASKAAFLQQCQPDRPVPESLIRPRDLRPPPGHGPPAAQLLWAVSGPSPLMPAMNAAADGADITRCPCRPSFRTAARWLRALFYRMMHRSRAAAMLRKRPGRISTAEYEAKACTTKDRKFAKWSSAAAQLFQTGHSPPARISTRCYGSGDRDADTPAPVGRRRVARLTTRFLSIQTVPDVLVPL